MILPIKKMTAFLVAISFLFSNTAFAEISKTNTADVKQQVQVTTDPSKIVVPRDYGLVKSRYSAGDSKKLVIHIQDAHCNYEAQSNIIKILECLIKNDGLGLVSVEGADGFIDTSWFKAFPDADIRKEVADYFMKKGEITGPEFLSITTNYPIKLFGAETREYYLENLNAFTSSYPLKEDTEKYFNQIKAALNKLKDTIYSDELKEFDTKSQDYEAKKISFTDYIKYLETLAGQHKLNMRQYDNLFKLVSVLVYEKKINFNVVDKERSALIDTVTKKLDKEQLSELVNKSLEFKMGKISSVEYYDYLKNLSSKYGVTLSNDYPNLFNYIIYNSVYSRIENESLFKDIKKFEEALKEKMFSNDEQRSLDKLSRHINILLGLVNIRLLNDDFDYYKAHQEEFSYEAFSSFINKMAQKFGFAFELDQPSDAVRESMVKLEDFYRIAIKRDKALVDNTLAAMKKESAQISVLVTGGFHSEGIARLLEQQGVSYIVVCPNITKDVETPYIKILTNQRTPLEDILNDSTAPATDAKNVKSSMLAPYLITAARINNIRDLTISARTATDVKGWADMCIEKWLPEASPALAKRLQQDPTPEILVAQFGIDAYAAIEAAGLPAEEAALARKNVAFIVKNVAPGIIAEQMKKHAPSARQKVIAASIKKMITDAGLTPDVLKDPKARSAKITEYNARIGGVRDIITGRSEEEITPNPIVIQKKPASKDEKIKFLKSVAKGERAWAVFGAGRATRMKLPTVFDELGIAGLTPGILKALPHNDDPFADSDINESIRGLIAKARQGIVADYDDVSIIQRQLIRLRNQIEKLVKETPEAGLTVEQVLAGVRFIDVVNEDNINTMANQLEAINFAGFKRGNIFLAEQPEEGGEEVLPDGQTRWQDGERWPEGHGDPFIAIAQRQEGMYRIGNDGKLVPVGKTLREALMESGTTKALFAQVNDLHLVEDMANFERWNAALPLMEQGKAQMVMEMVENKIVVKGKVEKQKGGATFNSKQGGSVIMRDTIALKAADLEKYAFPNSLSRMFYILDIPSLGQVSETSIPCYLNERETRAGKKPVITREFYSGDASDVLRSLTMQQDGFDIYTFKMRSRIGEALATMGNQDNESDFRVFVANVRKAPSTDVADNGVTAKPPAQSARIKRTGIITATGDVVTPEQSAEINAIADNSLTQQGGPSLMFTTQGVNVYKTWEFEDNRRLIAQYVRGSDETLPNAKRIHFSPNGFIWYKGLSEEQQGRFLSYMIYCIDHPDATEAEVQSHIPINDVMEIFKLKYDRMKLFKEELDVKNLIWHSRNLEVMAYTNIEHIAARYIGTEDEFYFKAIFYRAKDFYDSLTFWYPHVPWDLLIREVKKLASQGKGFEVLAIKSISKPTLDYETDSYGLSAVIYHSERPRAVAIVEGPMRVSANGEITGLGTKANIAEQVEKFFKNIEGRARFLWHQRTGGRDTHSTPEQALADWVQAEKDQGLIVQTGYKSIRLNGGVITPGEHGTNLKGHSIYARKRLELAREEKSLNGALARPIARGDAYAIAQNDIKLPPTDTKINLTTDKSAKMQELQKRLAAVIPGKSFIVVKGFKEELKKAGLENLQDVIFHYGVTRQAMYVDQEDFNYLFSLPNGIDIIVEAAIHEKAHLNNELANLEDPAVKLLSEAEVEAIATSINVRKAFMVRDMKNKDIDILKVSDEELAIKRTFGTNGIRSDDMGEEAQRRVAVGTAEVLRAQWQKANPGKELPWLLVGFDPRPQGVNGFNPGEMGESKAVAETLAAYGFKVLFVPKPIAAPFMIAVTGKGIHPKDVYASVMRTASHNEVIDPKSGRLVSGVKLFIDNAPAADTVTNLISERINNKQLASMAPRVKFDKAVADGNIVVVKDGDENDPDTVEFNRLSRVFDLVKLGDTFRKRYPNLKIAINTMNGGMSNFALRVFKAMGFTEGKDFRAFNTTLMNDKALEAKVTGWIEYDDPATSEHKRVRFAPDPTRPWMRGEDYTKFVASDPSNIIALLIDGDADRLVAELEKEIIPNDIGMLAAYYLAKYKGQTGRIVRTVPTTGGLDALSKALGLGEVQVTPVGSKWFAGPNKYYSGTLNDILVAVEESGHIGFVKNVAVGGNKELFFDHSIGLALLMLEMTSETGKTWQQLADEMWAFIKEKTGQDRIAAVRFGINKDDGAEKYYDLVARLGNPKEGAFRKEFGAKFEEELAAAGLPWKVNDFDITDAGGAQFKFVGGRKLFPRKSGTDGSVRLYIEVLETERNKAPELVKIMRKVMDHFIVPVAGKVSEKELAEVLDQKLHKPLTAAIMEMAPKFMQGGYNQIGYGVPQGAAIDGSFAIDDEGNQGYYVNGGKEIFLSTVEAMQKFFQSREKILGKPIRYIIKPGIGGQHTPFQGIADIFEMMDLKTGKIVGEYELGKNYESSIAAALQASGIGWDQVAVIPSSKSGSTDETMMIFTDIFNVMLKNIAAKEGLGGELFARTVINTMNQVNIVGGKERPAGDLFKGFSLNLVQKNLKAAGMRVEYEQVKKVFGIVLGNMFFETTDRPEQSRLSAFIRNSGLDKELGNNAPGFGAMFDNVGGRWTADLHMMTFLAYHKLNAAGYWFMRYIGIKSVRDGKHLANLIADKILKENITDIALVVPDELFWFGKAMEQNFNESIWQKGFANLVAIKASDWKYQKKYYESNPSKLVLNMAEKVLGVGVISKDKFNRALIPCPDFSDTEYSKDENAQSLANIFTTFYGMTHVVGNRLIVRALAEKGFTVDDVDLNDLNNPATKVFQQNLYLRQPYVELGKGLLEKKLKALQELGPVAIDNELARILGEASKGRLTTNLPKLNMSPATNNAVALSVAIMKAAKYAKETNRKFVPMIYLEGGKFIDIREHLVKLGIEWVMQGTGDQHISYQQVLAQPQKFLPFIVSFVPQDVLPGLPSVGFAKSYLNNVSPNMVRDLFAEASYMALTTPRKNEAGEDVTGAAGMFLRLTDTDLNIAMFKEAFDLAAQHKETAVAKFDHTIESIMRSSDTGERARKAAEAIFAKAQPANVKKHLIFVKSAIPDEQLKTTTVVNYANFCADYYNEMEGYTADIVDSHEKALELLAKNPSWDKTNTIVGLIDKDSLDKMTAALKASKMEGKTKLLPMERFDRDQFVPLKGFFDLMSVLVQVNRPLDKPEDQELKDTIRELLDQIGVRDVNDLLNALSVAAYFEDPIKFAKNFIVRLLPPTRAASPAELRERYNAAKKVVESL